MKKYDDITKVKGIGTKIQSLFHKLNIYETDDLIHHFPRTYVRMGEPVELSSVSLNETAAVKGRVKRTELVRTRGGKLIFHAYVADVQGRILICSWFNMPYLKNTIKADSCFVFYGKVILKTDRFIMQQAKVFDPDKYESMKRELQPVYSLTKGLNSNLVRSAIRFSLENMDLEEEYPEYLPKKILDKYKFMPRFEALKKLHVSRNEAELKSARDRMVFEEFFTFLIKLIDLRQKNEGMKNTKPMPLRASLDSSVSNLPFELTKVQLRSVEEVYHSMNSKSPMNRLLQGDVGSGKTIVAILSMILAYENGYQSAFMAPTEVLAIQHFESVNDFINRMDFKPKVILLTGSMTSKQKKAVYEKILNHEVDFIIGTHAIIQDRLEFANLGLMITDEQHRFGVRQREVLTDRYESVHSLIMSATPIPRTLAMMLYGDLELSIMDELPANRLPVKNAVLNEGHRQAANAFLLNQLRLGRQCYIVCPMIELNEELDLQNVVEYSEKLRNVMPKDVKIEALHGAMTAVEKNRIMDDFKNGEIDILVSTTVIEVGVNVPNATVMLVENADRFGLAQLHQLRGRVGRGSEQSYAMFMSKSQSDIAMKRLEVLRRSNDGFFIAEQDLKLRGPGELFGIKQSGVLSFRLADIYSDTEWLNRAVEEIKLLQKENPAFLKELIKAFKP